VRLLRAAHAARAAWIEAQRRLEAHPPNVQGAVWITLSALCFTFMGSLIKFLGGTIHSFEIAFLRCVIAFVFTLPFCLRVGTPAFRTERWPTHLGRAAVGMIAMFCGYYGLTKLPLADATAISFTRGLFMILLAVLLLGERVPARRWIATALGFAGVLIMVRPQGGGPVFASVVALLGAAFVSAGMVFIKKLAASERPETILIYYNFTTMLLSLPPALAVWTTPSLAELVLLGLVAALAGAGQFCTIRGYGVAEASAVAPFGYARLIFAALIGFVAFAEVPDRWSIGGAVIIAGSALYIALDEARLRRRGGAGRQPAPQPPAGP
jgi:drug/metabolite transporter (DMT)-like permease